MLNAPPAEIKKEKSVVFFSIAELTQLKTKTPRLDLVLKICA
jgi:hypothetical protein